MPIIRSRKAWMLPIQEMALGVDEERNPDV
jgi:hypothetical protein